MIALRRFGPLIALVLVGFGVVLARMAQVQIGEHAIWAREAAGLVRSSETLPYHRGRILDRQGRVIVQDEDAYEIELVYRTFRREHPLGQVAHARAALELRPVSLHLAVRELERWGLELVALCPDELAAFARGGALELEDVSLPAAADPAAEARAARAGELRFYLQRLLDATPREWSAMRGAAASGDGGRSHLELLARVRGVDPSELARARVDEWRAALARLEQLAWLLALSDPQGAPPFSGEEALVRLVEALQRTRDGVEDAIAGELFRLAAGFPAARLRPDLLLASFDLGWIATALRWDEARLELWAAGLAESFRANWDALFVEAATIRALLDETGGLAGNLLDEYAALFDAPRRQRRSARPPAPDWRRVDRLVVFDELETLFEEEPALAPPRGALLPFQEPALRRRSPGERDPWLFFADMALEPAPERRAELLAEEPDWRPPVDGAELAARFARCTDPQGAREAGARADRRLLPGWFVAGWERRFEEQLAAWMVQASESGPLHVSAARRERALEQYDYVVRDLGSRQVELERRPSYEVVQLVTRYPERFRGFEVRRTTRRRAVALDEAQRPVIPELIGVVRESSLREVIEQRELGRRLAQLQRKTERSRDDQEEMGRLVAQVYRNDELHGSSGVEGLYDAWLRGQNGYREHEGLEERAGEGRESFFVEPVDGRDLELTLDLDLQAAARRTLEHPVLPPEEGSRDTDWFASPVGAIVLITPSGEVLAAASVPREPGVARPGRDDERERVLERTLRMPTFNPLGSIFKPFAAAWALDRLGLDPSEELICTPLLDGSGAGYGAVHCHNQWGHGVLALERALEISCNSYFAQVGERFGGKQSYEELAHAFGFGEPSGVRRAGLGAGLFEEYGMPYFRKYARFDREALQRAANGLSAIEGTPMQAARAFAALATGVLPELRLDVPAGADDRLPGRPVPLSERSLGFVRRALVEVVRRGSAANKRLGPADLGFQLAAKTGSADYLPMNDEIRRSLGGGEGFPDMRKHTWLAGWFPAEDPVAVVVVYCHDVAFTASRTAVHVASQFLRTPEVQRFAREARR